MKVIEYDPATGCEACPMLRVCAPGQDSLAPKLSDAFDPPMSLTRPPSGCHLGGPTGACLIATPEAWAGMKAQAPAGPDPWAVKMRAQVDAVARLMNGEEE